MTGLVNLITQDWPALAFAAVFLIIGVATFELELRNPELHKKIGDSM